MLAGRRRFIEFLLGSPLLAATGLSAGWPVIADALPSLAVPEAANRALNVFQLKAAAQRALDKPAWHFIMNGADDGKTADANRRAFDDWQLRVRRLVDVREIDTRTELFGLQLASPIVLAPVGNQSGVHPDGELATARAALQREHLTIYSTMSSYSIGEIANEVSGAPAWFQLYASPDEALMLHLIRSAEQAGCRALVLTVDSPTRGNREGERWFARQADRSRLRLGNFESYAGAARIGDPGLSWDIVAWLSEQTRLPIVLKGIVTGEDARLSRQSGADGIIVSNHGGRQEESGRATLDCLEEVVAAAGGLPVLIDGGFRRGTDCFKALALGARAVCIGRPYLWGLGAFGEAGVDRCLQLLQAELVRIMQLAGTPNLSAISERYVTRG